MHSPSLPHERRNIAILAACQILQMLSSITVMTLSGVVGLQLGPEPALATLPIALMMLGTLGATLPASLLMKRLGRRHGFILGALLGGVGGGLLSVAGVALNAFALFCAGNLLLGIYQAFAMYYRFAAAEAASLPRRSRAIAWVLAGGVAAAFLGPWNASLTNYWLAGLPNAAPYLIIALAALLASGLLLQLRLPDSASTASAETERPLRLIVRQPTFVLALAAAAIAYAIMMLVMTATPLAMRARGFGMPEVALVMQWHVLGMFAPSFFSGILLARLGILRLLLLGCLLLAGCSLVALLGASLGHFWLALVLLGIGWNFLFVGGSTLLTTVHRDSERGKVQGVNDLSIFSLVALGSLLAGSLLHWLGWSGLNLAMLPLIAGLAVLTLWQAWLKRVDR